MAFKGDIMSNYTFGICRVCGKNQPLKDNVCSHCDRTDEQFDVPDFLKDLLNINKEK